MNIIYTNAVEESFLSILCSIVIKITKHFYHLCNNKDMYGGDLSFIFSTLF